MQAFLLAALLAASPAELHQELALLGVGESFAAGGVQAGAAPVAVWSSRWRQAGLLGPWGGEAALDVLDAYAFADRDLPASVHLRADRRVWAALTRPLGPGTASAGCWARWVAVQHAFAPPAPTFVFSGRQDYLAPGVGYTLAGPLGRGFDGRAAVRALPWVACLLDPGIPGPGWLGGLQAEGYVSWGAGPWSVTAGARAQLLIGTAGPFWWEAGPTLGVTARI